MSGYLDSRGLETLWGDIGETFATKDELAEKVADIKVDNDTIKVNSDGEMYVDIPSLMGVSY